MNKNEYFKKPQGMLEAGLLSSVLDKNKKYFAANASGNAMHEAGIDDGDLMIFEAVDHLEDGEIGMFFVDQKPVCRIYKAYDSGNCYLLAADRSREPYRIDAEDKSFSIGGKLAAVVKNMNGKKF